MVVIRMGRAMSGGLTSEMRVRNDAYVLITAAHNEEAYLETTIRSVLGQDVQPLRWIIVSDASTDRTDEIAQRYANENAWIELVRSNGSHRYSFAAKVSAIRTAYERLQGLEYGFVGILDADISLEPFYYSKLLSQFGEDSTLGLAGGFIYEEREGVFTSRPCNRMRSVAGAVQLFRCECYEGIGGISPLRNGGEDWCAEVSARMMGWTVKAFPELHIFHHRATGTANNLLRYRFRQGKMDFSLGCLPTFEVVKCIGRLAEKPVALGSLSRLAGFVWSHCILADRAVSKEFIQFLRQEQRRRLIPMFS